MKVVRVNAAAKTRISAPKEIEATLRRWLGCQRFVYNKALEQRIEFYEDNGRSLSYHNQSPTLKAWKKEFPWLKEPPAPSLQQTLLNLEQSYQNFFSGTAMFPKFKKKYKSSAGISFPQASQFSIQRLNKRWGEVDLPKLGKLRFYWISNIPEEVKSCVITQDGKYFNISFQGYKYTNKTADPSRPIGVDVGINVSVATSRPVAETGKNLFSLDIERIKRLEFRIASKQRLLANKTKGSGRWRRLKDEINKLHRKIRNIRHEFAHQLSAKIAKNHGLVFVEDLDVKEMMKSASGTVENPGTDVAKKQGLNRTIGRQGWGKFLGLLTYKASWYGDGCFPQNPAFSSQKCNGCKHISKENREPGSTLFQCQKCGLEEHADVNSSKNLEEDGLASLVAKFGSKTTIPLALRNQSKPKSQGKRRNLGASRRKPTHLPSRGQAGNGDKAGKNFGSLGDSTNDLRS